MCEQRRITASEKGISGRTSRSGSWGFTLVELLVVIAIIALLMSILMPALRRVKMQAEEVKCRGNLRQVGLIILMYLEDNDFKMPECYIHTAKSNKYYWEHPDGSLWLPSENDSYWGTAYEKAGLVKNRDVFGCPSFRDVAELRAATDKLYGFDAKLFRDSAFTLNGYMDKQQVNAIRNQGEVIVVKDHVEPRIENGNQDAFFRDPSSGEQALNHYIDRNRREWYRGIFRHNIRSRKEFETGGRANILWLDNHVSFIEERDIKAGKGLVRWYDPLKKYPGDW